MVLIKNLFFPPQGQRWKGARTLGAGLLILTSQVGAFAQESSCGPLQNAFGPFDYRTEKNNNLKLVEDGHFPPFVEALIRGKEGYLGGDLDYVLRAFPNHHRALMSVMRYGEKTKSAKPDHMHYSVECYFDRAIRFKPDDTIVRLIFATYLGKNAREPEALQQLEQANVLAKDNAFSHYNIGLIYLDLKQYDKALGQAHQAYALGFPQTALRDRLQELGKWKEDDTPKAPADASLEDAVKDTPKPPPAEPGGVAPAAPKSP